MATKTTKPAVKTATKAVATRSSRELSLDNELPDYLKTDQARGSENVGTQDLVIPRLDIVQALSPCIKKSDPAYIPNAEQGDIFNSVSRELLGQAVLVIPSHFQRQYLVWKDRNAGGGFRGAFDTLEEANDRIEQAKSDGDGPCEAQETHQHVVVIVAEGHELEQAIISMSRSKLKVSKQWNTLVRMNEGDRFSRVYELSSISETNTRKQDYWNWSVKQVRYVSPQEFEFAQQTYESVKGRIVRADQSE